MSNVRPTCSIATRRSRYAAVRRLTPSSASAACSCARTSDRVRTGATQRTRSTSLRRDRVRLLLGPCVSTGARAVGLGGLARPRRPRPHWTRYLPGCPLQSFWSALWSHRLRVWLAVGQRWRMLSARRLASLHARSAYQAEDPRSSARSCKRCTVSRLTPPSSGRPKAASRSFRLPLMSNVRSHLSFSLPALLRTQSLTSSSARRHRHAAVTGSLRAHSGVGAASLVHARELPRTRKRCTRGALAVLESFGGVRLQGLLGAFLF